MNEKDKASDLVCSFYQIQSNEYDYGINWEMAKQCALISVDEIIEAIQFNTHNEYLYNRADEYWTEVKQEIDNL